MTVQRAGGLGYATLKKVGARIPVGPILRARIPVTASFTAEA